GVDGGRRTQGPIKPHLRFAGALVSARRPRIGRGSVAAARAGRVVPDCGRPARRVRAGMAEPVMLSEFLRECLVGREHRPWPRFDLSWAKWRDLIARLATEDWEVLALWA